MRRFSQRNSLVTLNDINITPLLDLAFVLLIIFVITRPMLEQSIELNLPKGGMPKQVEAKNALTVEISPRGGYKLNGTQMASLDQMFAYIQAASQRNPDAFVAVRADGDGAYKYVAAVLDGCRQRGVTRFDLKTFPVDR